MHPVLFYSVRLSVRTTAFQVVKTGSIPVLSTKIIVSSRSNSFDRLRQKQGSEMQEYIIGVSPVGKRFNLCVMSVWSDGLVWN